MAVSDQDIRLMSISHCLQNNSDDEGDLPKRVKFKMEQEKRVCQTHGEYTAYQFKEYWTICPQCQSIKDKENEIKRRAAEDSERKKAVWNNRLGRAAIPERFADRTFENYIVTCEHSKSALATAKDYADRFDEVIKKGTCLIFSGDVGTGKTHLAISIANEILKRDYQPVFVSVIKAMRKIKETYAKDSTVSEDEAIRYFIEPDLLILDEVGVQFGSDTEKLYLFEIINGRYEQTKPTILISNLGTKELEGFIGARAMDRLRECGGKAVIFNWKSYRRISP